MAIDDLLARYVAGGGRLAATQARGLAAPPALHTVVLTCMDARIDVVALFGLKPGDVHVLRNAGGVVTDDVIRSLTISQRRLDTLEVLIMQHSGCGLTSFTDDGFAEELAGEVGMRPSWRTHAFRDPAVSVRRDIAQLRRDPFLRSGTQVRGFVLDIGSFSLHEIVVDGGPVATPAAPTGRPEPRRRRYRRR